MSATSATAAIAVRTAEGGSSSQVTPTDHSATSRTRNQARRAKTAAANPRAPRRDRISCARTRIRITPSTIPDGGRRRTSRQSRRAMASIARPTRAGQRFRTDDRDQQHATTARTTTPSTESRTTVGRGSRPATRTPIVAMSGRTRSESVSKNALNRIPAVAMSAGIDHCRYNTYLVATSAGPGIVLTTARPARSAPMACDQDKPGTRMRAGMALTTYANPSRRPARRAGRR